MELDPELEPLKSGIGNIGKLNWTQDFEMDLDSFQNRIRQMKFKILENGIGNCT